LSSENPVLTWGFTRAREVLEYPDGVRAWRRAARRRALELTRDEQFDAVISSSPPVSAHLIAAELNRQYGLTWVADFPHLWSQDHGVPYGPVRRWFDRRLEVRTLRGADALTTVIGALADEFGMLHGRGRVAAIEHGFDPATVNVEPDQVTREFTITYTGGWNPGFREPRLILRVLRGLIDAGVIDRPRLRVRFYGPREQWVQTQIDDAGLSDVVSQYGSVPQFEVFARQRESQVLLIPKSERALEGMISSKFYEYLAARRPILAIGGHRDVVNDKLEETGAGVSCESEDQALEAMSSFYREYRATGTIAWRGNGTAVEKYSQRAMARQFAELLEGAATPPRSKQADARDAGC